MSHITHLKGLIAAPFTPMLPDGALNLDIIPGYYRLLKSNGISGAFICGSTGEGVSLSVEEKKQVADAWSACCRTDLSFTLMMLVGGNSMAECKKLAAFAEEIGCNAISFTSPSYFKPANEKVLAAMCAEVAAAAPSLPFYYYHIPVLTGANLPMINFLQEVNGMIPNFTGIKYTHEDFMDYLSCLHFENGKYDMLWGRDENMLAALALGAKGSVGSTFNYMAPVYHNLIRAFESGDLVAARKWQQKSIDLIMLLGKYGGIATGKAFMKLLGLDCGKFRLPVSNMADNRFDDFYQEASSIGFFSCSSLMPEGVLEK